MKMKNKNSLFQISLDKTLEDSTGKCSSNLNPYKLWFFFRTGKRNLTITLFKIGI